MEGKLIAIYRNIKRPNDNEIKIYLDILAYNKLDFILLDSSDPFFWEKLKGVDLFIFKWGHDHHSQQIAKTIIPIIEKTIKIKCFPDLATCWHYDDKIKQFFLLTQVGFPAVPSYIFWDKAVALNWIKKHPDFPLVFKLCNGAGSLSVFLVQKRKKGIRLIKKMFNSGINQNVIPVYHLAKTLNYSIVKIYRYYFIGLRNRFFIKEKRAYWLKHKNYVYFQKYMPDNKWDTRVTTAGQRAHAFRRFNRPNDFRASGSNNWDIDPEKIDLRMVKIALEVSKHFGFQAMAYDFVYDEHREPKIVEMSYLYGGAGYPDFMNGYWDEDLHWHEGRFWPQYFELMDLLELPDLKLPVLDTNTSYKKAKIT